MKMKKAVVISLIGRPNVGKSTIFNRLMGKAHLAITHDLPGVTRDRQYSLLSVNKLLDPYGDHSQENKHDGDLILVDTGGFYPENELQHDVLHYHQEQQMQERVLSLDNHQRKQIKSDDLYFRMAESARSAIEESDLVLLVVDVREGFIPFDKSIMDIIRQKHKRFLILANKMDSSKQNGEEAQFYTLGIDEEQLVPLSGAHGVGFDDLRSRIKKIVHEVQDEKSREWEEELKFAAERGIRPREEVVGVLTIVGAPNAGKSTLLNYMVGSERAIVAPIPGTTIDPIRGYFDLYFGPKVEVFEQKKEAFTKKKLEEEILREFKQFDDEDEEFQDLDEVEEEAEEEVEQELLQMNINEDAAAEIEEEVQAEAEEEAEEEAEVEQNQESIEPDARKNYWRSLMIVDTAGIRRKASIEEYVESQSVIRALKSIDDSDIVIYLIDAVKGPSHQDARLCGIVLEKGKSLIIGLNKVDLLGKTYSDAKLRKEWMNSLRVHFPWIDFCEIIPVSAKHGTNLKVLRESIKKTVLVRHQKITTGKINQCIQELVEKNSVIPKGSRGKRLKVKYASQVKSSPPTFLLFSNLSHNIPQTYKRYLVNGLRQKFNFKNTPVHLIFRSSKKVDDVLNS